MDIIIILLLVVAAVFLFMVELFIIPGITIASVFAVGCLVIADFYAYTHLSPVGFYITLIFSLLACIVSAIIFMRSKTLDRMSLKQSITSSVSNLKEPTVKVGDTGTTTTRLALVGYVDMNGKIIEATSSDGFLNAHTPVVVERVTDGTIYVKKQ
jgi:membrane-bound ClpP family serine protease